MRVPLVTLYSRQGCHLCETAEATLRRLNATLPHTLRVVDISSDSGLTERYGLHIPVVEVGGRETAAPLSPSMLERELRRACQ